MPSIEQYHIRLCAVTNCGYKEDDPPKRGFGWWVQENSTPEFAKARGRPGSFFGRDPVQEAVVPSWFEGNAVWLRSRSLRSQTGRTSSRRQLFAHAATPFAILRGISSPTTLEAYLPRHGRPPSRSRHAVIDSIRPSSEEEEFACEEG
jgi:hypothetical protein